MPELKDIFLKASLHFQAAEETHFLCAAIFDASATLHLKLLLNYCSLIHIYYLRPVFCFQTQLCDSCQEF